MAPPTWRTQRQPGLLSVPPSPPRAKGLGLELHPRTCRVPDLGSLAWRPAVLITSLRGQHPAGMD